MEPRSPYQCIEVVFDKSAVVDNVSLEDNKKEEKTQHHIPKVTEDVVECAVRVGYKSVKRTHSNYS